MRQTTKHPVRPPQRVIAMWRKQGKTEAEIKAIAESLASSSKSDINRMPDDLTNIRNIGKYKAKILVDMGITTYQDLIDADSEVIADALNASAGWVAKYKAMAERLVNES